MQVYALTMRLVNTSTYRFEEFSDRCIPPYAILSHRWDRREATYQSYRCRHGKHAAGIRKIADFCEFVRRQRPPLQYIWVDTCCIDKRNSVELMEAMNSMYAWYENARICYVYLRDLPPKEEARKKERRRAFRESAWFQRGWTLQELLAPSHVVFCDRNWEVYDSKGGLLEDIESATGITAHFLNGKYKPHQASIAMRLSWASSRQTTKIIDRAYCMLGLFDVNMPLLYGEKEKAFIRLQIEIVKRTDDESIFAWRLDLPHWGMLAPSPEAFQNSAKIVNFKLAPEQRMPYEMTNKGLRFPSASDTYASNAVDSSTGEPVGYETHNVELGCFEGDNTCVVDIHPAAEERWERGPITIDLKRNGPTWRRIDCSSWCRGQNSARPKRRNGSYFGRGVQRIYFMKQPQL